MRDTLFRGDLKDERRTLNIEHPTSNEKQTSNSEHGTAISDNEIPVLVLAFIQYSMLGVGCWTFIPFR